MRPTAVVFICVLSNRLILFIIRYVRRYSSSVDVLFPPSTGSGCMLHLTQRRYLCRVLVNDFIGKGNAYCKDFCTVQLSHFQQIHRSSEIRSRLTLSTCQLSLQQCTTGLEWICACMLRVCVVVLTFVPWRSGRYLCRCESVARLLMQSSAICVRA